ncbi:cytochrome P450 3A30 [Amniculicola lignicola CBS 123094]|uniref:Cytochrome P450 3A30 n=1 Tax=Amniculicola lignicola CBS 123094 TaxID=1392246 RepID=A0A6A5W491_9PLEO|nr:cytochrome P450 3A30 [Amniculicola lignicola CBS 123094]
MDSSRWFSWLASAVVAFLAYFIVRFVQVRRFYKDLPGPPHSFFWGHLKVLGETYALFPSNIHIQLAVTELMKTYNLQGAFYLDLWPLGPRQLIIVDPDMATQITVLKSLPKHPLEGASVDPVVGENNIVTTDGAVWKRLHNMLAPAFAPSYIRNMVGMMADEAMGYRSKLLKMAESGEIFKLEDITNDFTFDVISNATFGFSLNAQTKRDSIDDFNDLLHQSMIVRDSWNPVTSLVARRNRGLASQKLSKRFGDMIQERFAILQQDNINVSNKRSLTILDLVLRDHAEELRRTTSNTSTILDESFKEMAITQIKAMLLGGSSTTADTICFMYMLLSENPEVLQKLRDEHDRVFAPGIDATYALLKDNFNKIGELEYTLNTIKETLRLFPIGCTARCADETGVISFKGRQYPVADHLILPMQFAMHYNAKYFPNPTKFDPDRFTQDDFVRTAWRPFERGPRACIGQTLALDEMKVLALLTVRDFDFKIADIKPSAKSRVGWNDLDLKYGDRAFQEYVFEAKPRHGMKMTVKKAAKLA